MFSFWEAGGKSPINFNWWWNEQVAKCPGGESTKYGTGFWISRWWIGRCRIALAPFDYKTFLTGRFVEHISCSIYLDNHVLNPLTLKDRCFINYLKYLHSYWTKPAYVKFLKYPLCLHFLELLQHEEFRKEIVNGQVRILTDLLTWSLLG